MSYEGSVKKFYKSCTSNNEMFLLFADFFNLFQ
jgi:hypothetical protein